MVVVHILQSAEFQQQLQHAGSSKAVFIDFFATWCGPCRTIAPVFQQLSERYSQSVFLKVDVDQLEDIARAQGITAMPTFVCFKGGVRVETLRGANPASLEEMVKKWSEPAPEAKEGGDVESLPKGQMDLATFFDKSGFECLNESDEHQLAHALDPNGGYLESDCDEQLIITITFAQLIKLHSVRIEADALKGPKTVKLFVNLPHSLDFDAAEGMEPVQRLDLTPEDLKEGNLINLKYVKFQNVNRITLFIKDNQGGEETTQIDRLAFIGCPVSTTNMNEFKRIAGKKGESH